MSRTETDIDFLPQAAYARAETVEQALKQNHINAVAYAANQFANSRSIGVRFVPLEEVSSDRIESVTDDISQKLGRRVMYKPGQADQPHQMMVERVSPKRVGLERLNLTHTLPPIKFPVPCGYLGVGLDGRAKAIELGPGNRTLLISGDTPEERSAFLQSLTLSIAQHSGNRTRFFPIEPGDRDGLDILSKMDPRFEIAEHEAPQMTMLLDAALDDHDTKTNKVVVIDKLEEYLGPGDAINTGDRLMQLLNRPSGSEIYLIATTGNLERLHELGMTSGKYGQFDRHISGRQPRIPDFRVATEFISERPLRQIPNRPGEFVTMINGKPLPFSTPR